VFRLFLGRRLHIEGLDNVPAEGPLLMVSNHVSNFDPPVYSFIPGVVFVMGKKELFRTALAKWLMAGWYCFPVDRKGVDRQALRTALEVLGAGRRLMIFAEGTVAAGKGMLRTKPGVGFLIQRSGAPVLPCAVWGTEDIFARGRWPRRAHVHLRFGAPIDGFAHKGATAQELADRAGREIAALLPESHRGEYADALSGGPRKP